jgi:hypothetical protein
MKMKTATRTSALGRVEAERHQADGLQALSSFGESTQKKTADSRLSLVERKGLAHMGYCTVSL